MGRLREAIRSLLAWQSILDDVGNGRLNIDRVQDEQARKEAKAVEDALPRTARECYRWLLFPGMSQPGAREAYIEAFQVKTAGEELMAEVGRICTENELVISRWSAMLKTEVPRECTLLRKCGSSSNRAVPGTPRFGSAGECVTPQTARRMPQTYSRYSNLPDFRRVPAENSRFQTHSFLDAGLRRPCGAHPLRQLVDLAQEPLGGGDPLPQAVPPDHQDRLDQRAHRIPQQDPVGGKVHVRFQARNVCVTLSSSGSIPICFWQPMASSVTMQPANSRLRSNSGTAVISLLLSASWRCPSTSSPPVAAPCHQWPPLLWKAFPSSSASSA